MHNLLMSGLLLLAPLQAAPNTGQASADAIVTQIRRADYEGDRAALKRLYADLLPFAEDKAIGSKVRYWRGFALWRRALNGFNESADHRDLEQELTLALAEIREGSERT